MFEWAKSSICLSISVSEEIRTRIAGVLDNYKGQER